MRTVKHQALTIALLAAFTAGVWACSPGVAKASGTGIGPEVLLVFGGEILTVSLTIFYTGVDLAYGIENRWLPCKWAVTQIIFPATFNLVYGTVILHSVREGNLYSTLHLAFGTWFLVHGILSLVLYERPHGKNEDKQKPTSSIDFGIAPVEGGAMGALAGRF